MDHLARSSRNFFSGLRLHRASLRRFDHEWLERRRHDPDTRLVPIWRTHSVIRPSRPAVPLLLRPDQLADPRPDAMVLLGTAGTHAYFAVDLGSEEEALRVHLSGGAELCELPDAGTRLDPQDGALLAYARALIHWHRRHRYCGDCGSPNRSREGGHLLECTNRACAAKCFPRTDPAVIVLVESASTGRSHPRCLLGRSPGWPPRVYSALAGFVEPGESLEDAVVREVREEAGVRVAGVRYHSSQPWPFPSSLMLGFRARALDETIDPGDQELEDARWFTRGQIVDGIGKKRLELPRRVSIAYRLVEDWFDAQGGARLRDCLPEEERG